MYNYLQWPDWGFGGFPDPGLPECGFPDFGGLPELGLPECGGLPDLGGLPESGFGGFPETGVSLSAWIAVGDPGEPFGLPIGLAATAAISNAEIFIFKNCIVNLLTVYYTYFLNIFKIKIIFF